MNAFNWLLCLVGGAFLIVGVVNTAFVFVGAAFIVFGLLEASSPRPAALDDLEPPQAGQRNSSKPEVNASNRSEAP